LESIDRLVATDSGPPERRVVRFHPVARRQPRRSGPWTEVQVIRVLKCVGVWLALACAWPAVAERGPVRIPPPPASSKARSSMSGGLLAPGSVDRAKPHRPREDRGGRQRHRPRPIRSRGRRGSHGHRHACRSTQARENGHDRTHRSDAWASGSSRAGRLLPDGEHTTRAPGFVPVASVQLLTRPSEGLSAFVMTLSVIVHVAPGAATAL
jgi:hypothetical protein